MKNLLKPKNLSRSSSQGNSSRSSSVTSGTDSGVDNNSLDGDVNTPGPAFMSTAAPMTGKSPTESSFGSGQSSRYQTAPVRTNFRVEHLASFPLGPGDKVVSAKERLVKAKELITKGEPWTKEMELSLTDQEIILLDCETQQLIEKYPLSHVDSVQDISDDPMLKSILVFSTLQTPEKYSAVHLFQCDKVPANVIAPEIQKLLLKRRESPKMNGQLHGVQVLPPPPDQPAPLPPHGVAAFSAAVAHKEHDVPRPPASSTKVIHGERYGETSSPDLMEAYINRDVQVLNHCIDDVEELVYKVKQVGEAWKQHEAKIKGKKAKSKKRDFEAIEARSPSREEFVDAFQKCKYSFILLGKLTTHIQNPNAPELVHYLIMPLSLLVRCTRGPQQASLVVTPLMTSESVELLRSCLTPKEAEFWQSLGPAWTLSRSDPHWSDKHVGHYEPKFKSGWVPPEIVGSGRSVPADVGAAVAANAAARAKADQTKKADREDAKHNAAVLTAAAKFKSSTSSNEPKSPTDSPSKGDIFKRVKALYSFTGKNPKELSVNQGEELMILDDSRQWWCVRNSSGAVGFLPNTILNTTGSNGSSVPSMPSPTSSSGPPTMVTNGHIRRQGSSSSDSSIPVFSAHSSLSTEGFSKLATKSESPKLNGGSSFEHMINSKATSLRKIEDSQDGPVERKRLSSADLLNDELKNKMSSGLLSPVPINRAKSMESAIILRKQSSATDVQTWMKSKHFSTEAMNAVKSYSAEELSQLTPNDISHLVGQSEGKKLYTQLTIEKSGDCWQKIVVHRGVSELQAVMSRRKNLSDGDENAELDQGIRNIVKAAQSDRHATWIERKLTKRSSLENLQDNNDKRAATQELTRQPSYELRRKPNQPGPPPTAPRVAPKPRPPSFAPPPPPPPLPPPDQATSSQFTGIPPAPILSTNDQKVDDLLREHHRQQELLKEQERQLTELRAQQKQKDEIMKYEESRIRLEQQVKDQEAMLKLLQDQQRLHQHSNAGQPNMMTAIQPNIGAMQPPAAGYVSYVPVQAMPGMPGMPGMQGMQMPNVQGYHSAQPIYTIPQVYGAMPPTLGYQQK